MSFARPEYSRPTPIRVPALPVPHLRVEEHQGFQIVVFDFFGEKDPKGPLRHIDALTRFMASQPRTKSLLTLTDVREAHYDSATIAVLKKFAAHNAPFVKAAAVLCTSPTHRLAVTTVARFTGRTMRAFAEPVEAKEWLIRQ